MLLFLCNKRVQILKTVQIRPILYSFHAIRLQIFFHVSDTYYNITRYFLRNIILV